jgi:hypothetical protein
MPDGGERLTTEPGPDLPPIHNRQMVLLDRADWLAWLDLTRPEPELLRPLPTGSLAANHHIYIYPPRQRAFAGSGRLTPGLPSRLMTNGLPHFVGRPT